MDAGKEMKEKSKKLVGEGDAFKKDFLDGCGYRWYRHSARNADYVRWKRDCLALVKAFFGADSRDYSELADVEKDRALRGSGSVFMVFLKAVKKTQIEAAAPGVSRAADRLEDFLARAEGLARKGYYVSAVTLAGTVLEDVLRRLCEVNSVFCAENATLETLNDKLRGAGVYSPAWHRETALRISLRRTAELCYTEKITERNVLEMISWLREFVQRQFSRSGSVKTAA